MGGLLFPILVVLVVSAAIVFSRPAARSRLTDLVNLLKDGKLNLGSKLAELAGRINVRSLIDLRRLSQLVNRIDFGSRLKPDDSSACPGYSGLISRVKSQFSRRQYPDRSSEYLGRPDLDVLNCRVTLAGQKDKSQAAYDRLLNEYAESTYRDLVPNG